MPTTPIRRAPPAWLKRVVRGAVDKLGYEIVSHDADALEGHVFARHLRRLFRQVDVQCVLDVGANRGQYRRFLRDRVGFKGPIVSFEPVARNVELLREQARADPSWIIEGYALGNEDARRSLNVMRLDLLSSFLDPRSSSVPMFRDFNVVDHHEDVEVRRLDSVLDGLRSRHNLGPAYLKLDTQGFDLEVVRGAAATLPMIRALQTELSVRPIYEGAPPYHEMLAVLTARRFDITGMFPVVRDELLRVIEFDCVMVNAAAGF